MWRRGRVVRRRTYVASTAVRVRSAPCNGDASPTLHEAAVSAPRVGKTGWSSVLFSLAVLSLFAVTMIGLRIVYTQSWDHIAIGWNLLLAWIPFVAALVVSNRAVPGTRNLRLIAATLIWLLFLPNAPYLITDLQYVGQSDS